MDKSTFRIGQGERAKRIRKVRWTIPWVLSLAVGLSCASKASAIITTPYIGQDGQGNDVLIPPFPQVVNFLVGADRFYNNGFFGSDTLLTNVEAGFIWNGQESTSGRVTAWISDPSLNFPTPQYDYHATAVGFTLGGLGPQNPDGSFYLYQFGMAPTAVMVSAATATAFGDDGQFTDTARSFTYAYQTAMAGTGGVYDLFAPNSGFGISGPKSDVINSSWGLEDPAGTDYRTRAIDALAFANHNTVCFSAGNDNAAVGGPASGYNSIAVGALMSDTTDPAYSQVASFSNHGPNDFYNPVTGVTIPNVRPGVDIVAPGTNLYLATYVGQSGANGDGQLFDIPGNPPNIYLVAAAGTSFASPIVAGGAALIVDAGYQVLGGGTAVDGRVVKAVLLNSAKKLPGWTNNPSMVNGVETTTQSLDYYQGAGELDLNRGYDQFLGDTTDLPALSGGTVGNIGWDFGEVLQDPVSPKGYAQRLFYSSIAGGRVALTVTLDWFIDRSLDSSALADPSAPDDAFSAADVSFDQLDLQIWSTDALGNFLTELAAAPGGFNNVDHLYYLLPADGYYGIRVLWAGNIYDVAGNTPKIDDFGLAWYVPEPGSLALIGFSAIALVRRSRRRLR